MMRGELARRIAKLCNEIASTAPVPDPFTFEDANLARALLDVVQAWNTHGTTARLGLVALAYWHDWMVGVEGGAADPSAFREGAQIMEQIVGEKLADGLPDGWNHDEDEEDDDEPRCWCIEHPCRHDA